MTWLKKLLSGTFDQRGGAWVGMATFSVILMAWLEFFASGVNAPLLDGSGRVVIDNAARVVVRTGWHPSAPSWWIVGATCIYVVILTAFVVSKSGTYLVDSKYNSPPDTPPQKEG